MFVKIAIIVLLVALLFGCNSLALSPGLDTPATILQDRRESISDSDYESTFSVEFTAGGMTYRAVYVKYIGQAVSMHVINVTKDSLDVDMMKHFSQPQQK